MKINHKLTPFLLPFLAFSLLSCTNILIYNQEVLVAVTFFAFLVFVFNYFGNNIKLSLQERKQGIKQEFHQFFLLKKKFFHQVRKEYQKGCLLKTAFTTLDAATTHQLKGAEKAWVERLNSLFSHQIKQKVATLSLSNPAFQSLWQQGIADYQLSLLLGGKKKKN